MLFLRKPFFALKQERTLSVQSERAANTVRGWRKVEDFEMALEDALTFELCLTAANPGLKRSFCIYC